MSQIFAGTAFGQVFRLPLQVPKQKQMITKYGIMKKERIISVTECYAYDNFCYASQKNVYAYSFDDETESTLFGNKHNVSKIIGVHASKNEILATLNNGALVSISKEENEKDWQNKQILAGKFEPSLNKHYTRSVYDGQSSFCFVGKEVLPFLFDSVKNIVAWNGKNVPNDELDLRVPVNDTDATFFKNRNCLACAHAGNKVRVYDVRTNKQKPSADHHLKLQKVYTKSNLTNIRVSVLNENLFYISNDLGGIYECDMRYQMRMTGKFKGINSTVTDILTYEDKIYASSLDSYVRIYNLETKQLEEKHYMNKPIYSIKVRERDAQDPQDFQEQVLSDEQEQPVVDPESKKMKKLRKRNKVNLKYLKPVNWDEVPIKEELLQQAKEEYEQINSKDADSYIDEEVDGVKDQHRSDQERDSDLD